MFRLLTGFLALGQVNCGPILQTLPQVEQGLTRVSFRQYLPPRTTPSRLCPWGAARMDVFGIVTGRIDLA
jgi:hypothetical protein